MMSHYLFLLFAFLYISNSIIAQPPRVQQSFSWFQKGYYIINPSIANTRNNVAFTRQLSGKDSSIPVSDLVFGAKENFLVNAANRTYDPVVCLYKIDSKQLSLIDFGWSPVFSTNDNRIAYAYQAKPMEKQDKMYASSYKGNTIKTFNRATGKIEEVAKPLGDYLMDPFFTDSLNIVYKTGGAINGPFGGGISFNEVNLKTKKINTVRQAIIKYRLFDLMGEPYLINKKLAYTVYSPADSGTGMAGEYLHLLLRGNDTIQNFGSRRYTNLNYKFAVNEKTEVLFLDDGHFMEEDTNYLNTYKSNMLINKKPLSFKYTKAYLSPNGKHILYITQGNEAYLVNSKTFEQTKLPLPAKEFHAVVWGGGSNNQQVAVVQDHENLVGTDRLYLFKIQ